jgi:hypothetical protein
MPPGGRVIVIELLLGDLVYRARALPLGCQRCGHFTNVEWNAGIR